MTKVVFYHVPKNAGTAIYNGYLNCPHFRRAGKSLNKDHVKVSEDPPKPDEVAFTVIRDPVDRFVSIFYHIKNIEDPEHPYNKRHKESECEVCSVEEKMKHNHFNIHHFNDVNEFAKAIHFKTAPYHEEAVEIFKKIDMFRPQMHWINKRILVLRQSNLEHDFKIIEKLTNCNMNWKTGSLANEGTYNVKVDSCTEAIVRELYDIDYAHFNFK